MLRIIALLFVLLASPAYAVNELQGQPWADVVAMAEKHKAAIEKLNDADSAALDESLPGRPMPSSIYLMTLGDSVIVVLVRDGEVLFSSPPVNVKVINKALHRVGA